MIVAGRLDGAIPYGTVIMADEQTAGYGRMGRSFASPAADSIYVSFILKPIAKATSTPLITVMAAVAVCETIETMADGEPRIKWVNDIYMGGRKVCGILAEAVSVAGSGLCVVLGIGVNINVPPRAFPEGIRETAGSVRIAPQLRCRFAADLIKRVACGYDSLALGVSPVSDYRRRSFIIGSEVIVVKSGGGEASAVAEEIADDGSLLVRYADGRHEALNSGEVRVRLG
jgi:BirA family biotin operon repressor/biotin-[acetyl-CoA-carboxylase] ligase